VGFAQGLGGHGTAVFGRHLGHQAGIAAQAIQAALQGLRLQIAAGVQGASQANGLLALVFDLQPAVDDAAHQQQDAVRADVDGGEQGSFHGAGRNAQPARLPSAQCLPENRLCLVCIKQSCDCHGFVTHLADTELA